MTPDQLIRAQADAIGALQLRVAALEASRTPRTDISGLASEASVTAAAATAAQGVADAATANAAAAQAAADAAVGTANAATAQAAADAAQAEADTATADALTANAAAAQAAADAATAQARAESAEADAAQAAADAAAAAATAAQGVADAAQAAADAAAGTADAAAAQFAADAAQTEADNAAAAALAADTAAATAQTEADAASAAAASAQATADAAIVTGGAAADVNTHATTISGGKIRTGRIESGGYNGPDGAEIFADAGSAFDLDASELITTNFVSTPSLAAVKVNRFFLVDDGDVVVFEIDTEFSSGVVTLGPHASPASIVFFTDDEDPANLTVASGGASGATLFLAEEYGGSLLDINGGAIQFNNDDTITYDDTANEYRFESDGQDVLTIGDADVDGGWYLGEWDNSGSWNVLGTANMTGTEYVLISNGTDTWLGAGTGGKVTIRPNAHDGSPSMSFDGTTGIITTSGTIDMSNGVLADVNEVRASDGSAGDASYCFTSNQSSGMYAITDGIRLVANGTDVFGAVNNAVYLPPAWDNTSTGGSYLRVTGGAGLVARHSSSVRYKEDRRPMTLEEARRVLDVEWFRYTSNAPGDAEARARGWSHYGAGAEQVADDVDPRYVGFDMDAELDEDSVPVPESISYDLFAAPHGVLIGDHDQRLELAEQRVEALDARNTVLEDRVDSLGRELVELRQLVEQLAAG